MVKPTKITIQVDELRTLNDFQKLLGDINWIRPYLHLPTSSLGPLFDTLKGDSDPLSKRVLTPKARTALNLVETALEKVHLDRIDLAKPLSFIVLATNKLPTGVFWQKGPILWVHMNYAPNKVLSLLTESLEEKNS